MQAKFKDYKKKYTYIVSTITGLFDFLSLWRDIIMVTKIPALFKLKEDLKGVYSNVIVSLTVRLHDFVKHLLKTLTPY